MPHDPRHGSMHFSLTQALSLEQSVFIEHSGRQFGGLPKYCGKQEQDGEFPILRHCENGPQGDGRQGSEGMATTSATEKLQIMFKSINIIQKIIIIKKVKLDSFLENITIPLKHLLKGSPVNWGRHEHIGLWLITLHSVFCPQTPSQGFIHFFRIHAWFWLHSELTRHSGLQFGGTPMNSDWQVHTAWSFETLQILFGPQGVGVHGSLGKLGTSENEHVLLFIWIDNAKNVKKYLLCLYLQLFHNNFHRDYQSIQEGIHIMGHDLQHYI